MKWLPAVVILCTLADGDRTIFIAADYSDEDGDSEGCQPRLADKCFVDVFANMECHLSPMFTSDCINKTAQDFCSSFEDALDCSIDVVSEDCSEVGGMNLFRGWMNGLMNVYKTLCLSDLDLVNSLIANPFCWNSVIFSTCFEAETKIEHVVSFLTIPLDLPTCNRIVASAAMCNVRATTPIDKCMAPQRVISEVLQSFFTGSSCGSACTSASHAAPRTAHATLAAVALAVALTAK